MPYHFCSAYKLYVLAVNVTPTLLPLTPHDAFNMLSFSAAFCLFMWRQAVGFWLWELGLKENGLNGSGIAKHVLIYGLIFLWWQLPGKGSWYAIKCPFNLKIFWKSYMLVSVEWVKQLSLEQFLKVSYASSIPSLSALKLIDIIDCDISLKK